MAESETFTNKHDLLVDLREVTMLITETENALFKQKKQRLLSIHLTLNFLRNNCNFYKLINCISETEWTKWMGVFNIAADFRNTLVNGSRCAVNYAVTINK